MRVKNQKATKPSNLLPKNQNKNVKSNHISDNLFVNYQITNKYIHFPVLNKEENENSKNEIVVYNTNNLLYGCKKMS